MVSATYPLSSGESTGRTDLVGVGHREGWVLATIWFAAVGTLSVMRVWSLQSGALDLGFMVHALAAVSRRGLTGEASWAGWSFLEDHFSPLVLPLAWPAATRWGAYVLVVAQAMAVAVSIVVAAALIRRRVHDRGSRRLLLLAYAFAPPLLFSVYFDFHASVVAVPFLLAFLLGIDANRPILTVLGAAGTALAREDMAVLVVLVVLANWRALSRVRLPLLAFCGLCLFGWWATKGGPGYAADTFWGYLDLSDLSGSLRNAATAAWAGGLLPRLLVVLSLPWLLWRMSWRHLAPLFVLALALVVANTTNTKLLGFHYWFFAPPLALGAVLQNWSPPRDRRRTLVGYGTVIALAAGGPLVASFLAPSADSGIGVLSAAMWRGAEIRAVHDEIACLPVDGSVAADSRVIPLLAHMAEVYVLPHPFEPLVFIIGDQTVHIRDAASIRPDFLLTSSDEVPSGYARVRASFWATPQALPTVSPECLEASS